MSEEELVGLLTSLVGCGVVLVILAFYVFVWWRIFAKAGYSGALGLTMIIPLVNFVMLLVLAFAEWPIQRELDRQRGGGPVPRQY